MAPKSKSIFRQPGSKHFQLVHRSQRDPLIHDPDSSKHVLKEFERGNTCKGKSRADLDLLVPAEDRDRANIGEAAVYGIYYDDTEYNYMQHLRPVGIQEDGVDSVLIEPPSPKTKGKGKGRNPISLVDIPQEALPSLVEIPKNFETQEAIPWSIAGFQPDMDPHLRQVLQALEDDAFVEDDLGEGFFGELVAEGERAPSEEYEYEFHEDGLQDEETNGSDVGPSGDSAAEHQNWEARFKLFKTTQNRTGLQSDDDSDVHSEGADTVGTLPQLSVIGGKRRRRGTSDASGYSMSSSSMFRNEGLTTLDERFDQIQKDYDSDGDDEEQESDTDSAPELITSREDFDSMMNEFMDNYEVLGGKMRPVLPGETSIGKLDVIRKALGDVKIREQVDGHSDNDDDILMPLDVDDKADRWDCETILTTYSNLDNHPRLIHARGEKSLPRIRLDPKTGLPNIASAKPAQANRRVIAPAQEDPQPTRTTVTRPRNEPKEEKRLRKQAVKMDRQDRRAEKKATKEQFSNAIRNEVRVVSAKEKTTKIRKL